GLLRPARQRQALDRYAGDAVAVPLEKYASASNAGGAEFGGAPTAEPPATSCAAMSDCSSDVCQHRVWADGWNPLMMRP
ncbi:hypothetical protein AB0K46_22765, partial [Streptomyces cinnamoneus]